MGAWGDALAFLSHSSCDMFAGFSFSATLRGAFAGA
jgi:hypothetical protein